MRIKTLTLERFRSYHGVTLNLDAPRVLIAGVNGAGKSSIREAVRWVLTNRCDVVDGRGSGYAYLYPEGTQEVRVRATVDPIGAVERARVHDVLHLSVENVMGDAQIQQGAIYYRLDGEKAIGPYLEAVMSTEHFLRLHHAEAKALVLDMLQVRIPYEGQMLSLDQVELRYQNAFAERKTAKATAKMLKVPEAPAAGMFAPLADIDAQLDRLREEYNARTLGIGQNDGKRQILQERLDRVQGTVKAITDEQIAELVAEVVRLENAIADEGEPVPVPASPMDRVQRLQFLTKQVDKLTAFKPSAGCVLDAEVPCPQKKIAFTKQARAYQTEIAGMPGIAQPEAPSKTRDLRAQLAQAQRWLEEAQAASKHNREVAVEVEAIQAQMAALATLTPEQRQEADILKARIVKGEAIRREASEYWRNVERHEEAVERKRDADARVETLEALCDTLGPNGIRLDALAKAIAAFTARINTCTQPFGWSVEFSVDPWQVIVNGRPVQTFSESEQFRLGIAVQLAIAEMSGLSFAIVDRLDMLDVRNRALATKMIFAAPVQQVLVLSTREPEQALPQIPGAIVHRVAQVAGRSIVLESQGV